MTTLFATSDYHRLAAGLQIPSRAFIDGAWTDAVMAIDDYSLKWEEYEDLAKSTLDDAVASAIKGFENGPLRLSSFLIELAGQAIARAILEDGANAEAAIAVVERQAIELTLQAYPDPVDAVRALQGRRRILNGNHGGRTTRPLRGDNHPSRE